MHGRGGHHARGGDGHAVEAGKFIGKDDTRRQNDDRQHRRFHAYGQSANDVGRVARAGFLHDGVHRMLAHGGVVFRDDGHQSTHDQSRDDGVEHAVGREFKAAQVERFG